ncbi:MAG TPA: tRNA preQ1(34) S-adenosylmethionine ribosyltransferase-isomerase QueA [Nitrospira sp.]|jgi:S-adenosylmethionine:tRNA ribosyltransferase-isomerase|nr:tRNA preQ1(34) S-adenosylmethionine ribosyltransferase-isomerase QueA [Nitrospira sp.]
MLLSEFDFPFDPALVADQPVLPRDRARMLVIDRSSGLRTHRHVADLPSLLEPGDLVVVNNTKVMPARVSARVRSSGKLIDLLFVQDLGQGVWEVLMKGRFRPGSLIEFESGGIGEVLERNQGRTTLKVTGVTSVHKLMQIAGAMPLPPYIKRHPTQDDVGWYQTMFAQYEGAIAAPTAGLHFTPELVDALIARNVALAQVTLHVGPGTFQSVKSERIEDHRMMAEWIDVPAGAVQQIRRAKQQGRRVVAVGTTVVRALESAARSGAGMIPFQGAAELFITPGFKFQVVDALLTNFHLPRTTLLMLVSALVGTDSLRAAYAEAVASRYRFYSYGDAMLIGTGWRDAT